MQPINSRKLGFFYPRNGSIDAIVASDIVLSRYTYKNQPTLFFSVGACLCRNQEGEKIYGNEITSYCKAIKAYFGLSNNKIPWYKILDSYIFTAFPNATLSMDPLQKQFNVFKILWGTGESEDALRFIYQRVKNCEEAKHVFEITLASGVKTAFAIKVDGGEGAFSTQFVSLQPSQ